MHNDINQSIIVWTSPPPPMGEGEGGGGQDEVFSDPTFECGSHAPALQGASMACAIQRKPKSTGKFQICLVRVIRCHSCNSSFRKGGDHGRRDSKYI